MGRARPGGWSRRQLLATAGIGWACRGEEALEWAGSGGDALDPPWTPPGTLDAGAFPFGVQSGDPGAAGVVLTVRTDEPAVTLCVVALGADGAWVPVVRAVHPAGGAARAALDGLAPDTEHGYVWLGADGERRSAVGRFRTAPARGAAPRVVRLGASCCLGHANPAYPTLALAAEQRLDAFLLLGDAIYTDASTLAGYRRAYDALLATPSVQALTASTSLIPVWDDHEVANDWVPADPRGPRGERAGRLFDEALPHSAIDAPLSEPAPRRPRGDRGPRPPRRARSRCRAARQRGPARVGRRPDRAATPPSCSWSAPSTSPTTPTATPPTT
ncbi:MAG: alkaline phosphatase D family protein [Myxococcota bacterium]